jgi:hypothetical protein
MLYNKLSPRKLQSCFLASLLSIFLILVGATHVSAQASPTPTPDPAMQALEVKVEGQARELGFLSERLKLTNERLETRFWIALVAATVFGITGIVGYEQAKRTHDQKMKELEDKFKAKERELWDNFVQKMNARFEQELYGLDATMLTVRIPEGDYSKKLKTRLNLSGFKNVSSYREFGRHLLRGITVVLLSNQADEDKFKLFMEQYRDQLKPEQAAFVLYAPQNHRVQAETLDLFDNLSLANTPTSLATNILAVGRGLMP